MTVLKDCRVSSKKRGHEFNITYEDILVLLDKQDHRCAFTGREFTWTSHSPGKFSIDRIDSGKGYVLENIQLVCGPANMAKHWLTHEEFLQLCREVTTHELTL